MMWTLYKYDKNNLESPSSAVKSSDDLSELQSFAMNKFRQNGHSGVWQNVDGQQRHDLFSLSDFGVLLYFINCNN